MSILSRLERRLEDAVEGVFSRAFPGPVQPVEIARRLSRVLEEGKVVSLSATYVPNVYRICLNPTDFAPMKAIRPILKRELVVFLTEQAQEGGYRLAGPVSVTVEEREEVSGGHILVESHLVADEDAAKAQPAAVITPAQPDAVELPQAPAQKHAKGDTRVFQVPPSVAAELLVQEGRGRHGRIPLGDRPVTIGRRRDCDLILSDGLVSRVHARIERSEGGHVVIDLGSTNGTLVNGDPVDRHHLRHGDMIAVGDTIVEYRVHGLPHEWSGGELSSDGS